MGVLDTIHWPTFGLAVAVTVVLFVIAIAVARSA